MGIQYKRYSPRVELRMPVQFHSLTETGNQIRQGEVHNVSAQGLYFVTKERLTMWGQIRVLLELPRELSDKPPAAYLYTGMVIRVTQTYSESEGYGIGVKFLYYSDVDSQSIDLWVGPKKKRHANEPLKIAV
jgi:PilZ domain